jgi:adenylyltransferase/sulfurtransferase
MMRELTKEEQARYSRMISLPEMGEESLIKLKQSKVLVIGAGGLGSVTIPSLAAAGVGNLGIVEFDKVEESNLQRQLLYTPSDIGKEKIHIAKTKAEQLNPNIEISIYKGQFNQTNSKDLVSAFDLILDCTDNLPTRFLINDTCAELKKPLIYASVSDYKGIVTILHHQKNINLRDIFPDAPEKAESAGIIPTLPLVIGSIQANEAIKLLTETGNILDGQILTFNILKNTFHIVNL